MRLPCGRHGPLATPPQSYGLNQPSRGEPQKKHAQRICEASWPLEADKAEHAEQDHAPDELSGLGRSEGTTRGECGAKRLPEADGAGRGGTSGTAQCAHVARQWRGWAVALAAEHSREVPFAQHDLGRVLEVGQIHVLHLVREALVLDRNIEFPVAKPALDVQVARTDPCPLAVGDGGLGVDHRTVPFEDANSRFEQLAITRARHVLHYRQIGAAARHQQPHVDAVVCRGDERLHVRRGPDEIRVRDPEPLAGQRGDELIETEHPGGRRLRGNDAELVRACGSD